MKLKVRDQCVFWAILENVGRPKMEKTDINRTTMHDAYHDGTNHLMCLKCGFCLPCGDCRKYGCNGNVITKVFPSLRKESTTNGQ